MRGKYVRGVHVLIYSSKRTLGARINQLLLQPRVLRLEVHLVRAGLYAGVVAVRALVRFVAAVSELVAPQGVVIRRGVGTRVASERLFTWTNVKT